jgi:hypothetical protein
MTVAAERDPYYALPKLRGGPAYARPPRVAPESERPFDPDDLPIAAEQTADYGTITGMLFASGSYRSIGSDVPLAAVSPASPLEGVGAAISTGPATSTCPPTSTHPATSAYPAPSASAPGVGASRFSLRNLTDRLGPRPK